MNGGSPTLQTQIAPREVNGAINREQYLTHAIDTLRTHIFEPSGYQVPENIRVSCSWPSRGGMGRKRRVIGQCWDASCSADGRFEIFISPRIADPVEVLEILTHELIHIVVGIGHGHRGPFPKCAETIGLEGKMTATRGGEAFKRAIAPLIESLGPYPHSALDPFARSVNDDPQDDPAIGPDGARRTSGAKPQKGRMRKTECPECGLTFRVSGRWLEAARLGCPDIACDGHDFPMQVT